MHLVNPGVVSGFHLKLLKVSGCQRWNNRVSFYDINVYLAPTKAFILLPFEKVEKMNNKTEGTQVHT